MTEAKRIGEEINNFKNAKEASQDEESERLRFEDLMNQYKEVFVKANYERLTAFKEECKNRHSKMVEQTKLMLNEQHMLKLQVNEEMDEQTWRDYAMKNWMKRKKLYKLFDTYYHNAIAGMMGITDYDQCIIREFIFGAHNSILEGSEEKKIENVFNHQLQIFISPTDFNSIITHFSAGGLGACAYNKNISAAELVRCWEHDEFTFVCPECGETAYIYQFAGHVNGGGYWKLTAYCPKCCKHLHYSRRDVNPVKIHWSKLKNVADSVYKEIQEIKDGTGCK